MTKSYIYITSQQQQILPIHEMYNAYEPLFSMVERNKANKQKISCFAVLNPKRNQSGLEISVFYKFQNLFILENLSNASFVRIPNTYAYFWIYKEYF